MKNNSLDNYVENGIDILDVVAHWTKEKFNSELPDGKKTGLGYEIGLNKQGNDYDYYVAYFWGKDGKPCKMSKEEIYRYVRYDCKFDGGRMVCNDGWRRSDKV